MTFHEYRLLADDSHEIPCLIFKKIVKLLQNILSAAVVMSTLRIEMKQFYMYSSRMLHSYVTL